MRIYTVILAVVLLVFTLDVHAIPTSWTGAVTPADMPASLYEGAFESGTAIRLLYEQQMVMLANDLDVNLTQPGNYNRYTFDSTAGLIPAGTRVNSYLLHFDPVGHDLAGLSGSVTFGNRILGLIVLRPEQLASNPILGAPGTTYYNYAALSGNDLLGITLGMNSISVDLFAHYHVDNVRVITNVPDVTNAALLMGCALVSMSGFGWFARRRAC